MGEPLEGLIERLDQHVRYQYMPAGARLAMEEAAQALRLLGEVEKALETIAGPPERDPDLPDIYEPRWSAGQCRDIARSTLDKLRKGMGDG